MFCSGGCLSYFTRTASEKGFSWSAVCKSKFTRRTFENTQEQLNSLPEDSTDIFQRNSIDRYLPRPLVSFCDGKYNILDSFCFAEFTAYYSLIYKPKEINKGEEYQPDLPFHLTFWWKVTMKTWIILKLSNWWILMKKCSLGKFVEFLVVIRLTNIDVPIIYFFISFRSEKELLGGHLSTYQEKLAEPGIMDIINENLQNFEPYAVIVDRAYENLNWEFVDNQDAHGQIENDETGEPIYSEDTEPNEQNSQVHESNLVLGDFIPKIATDDKNAANIKSLNKKQFMVFDVLHQWARKYVKNVSSIKSLPINPVHIFLSGSGGTGTSHLVKTIYQVVSNELLYHSKKPDKSRVMLLSSTGLSTVNIAGTTIYSGLGIKPGVKLLGLRGKIKASSRNKLSEVKMVITDELSMVSRDLFFQINARLLEIFMCSIAVEPAGLAVVLAE